MRSTSNQDVIDKAAEEIVFRFAPARLGIAEQVADILRKHFPTASPERFDCGEYQGKDGAWKWEAYRMKMSNHEDYVYIVVGERSWYCHVGEGPIEYGSTDVATNLRSGSEFCANDSAVVTQFLPAIDAILCQSKGNGSASAEPTVSICAGSCCKSSPSPAATAEGEEKPDPDDQLIDERDAAEEAISQAYYLVTGNSPEWSNQFGYQQALQDIADAVRLLKSAAKAAVSRSPVSSASPGEPREGDLRWEKRCTAYGSFMLQQFRAGAWIDVPTVTD